MTPRWSVTEQATLSQTRRYDKVELDIRRKWSCRISTFPRAGQCTRVPRNAGGAGAICEGRSCAAKELCQCVFITEKYTISDGTDFQVPVSLIFNSSFEMNDLRSKISQPTDTFTDPRCYMHYSATNLSSHPPNDRQNLQTFGACGYPGLGILQLKVFQDSPV